MSSIFAHQLLEVREVFSEAIEGETLFKEPSVRDEGAILREMLKPDVHDVVKINVESLLNDSWGGCGRYV